MDIPSDIADSQDSIATPRNLYTLFARGWRDIEIGLELNCSSGLVSKWRRVYYMNEIAQLGKIVLKDGTIIPLTKQQIDKVNAIIKVSSTFKKIKVGDYRVFAINEIETDPEEIAKLSQLQLDIGAFPQVPLKKGYRNQDLA